MWDPIPVDELAYTGCDDSAAILTRGYLPEQDDLHNAKGKERKNRSFPGHRGPYPHDHDQRKNNKSKIGKHVGDLEVVPEGMLVSNQ